MAAVTRLLDAAAAGDPSAAAELLPLVYTELRNLAAARLAAENPGHTLQADSPGPRGLCPARGRSRCAIVEQSRPLLCRRRRSDAPHPRRKCSPETPGQARRRAAQHRPRRHHGRRGERPTDLLALDEVLSRLAQDDPAKAELVKLRYFAGLTLEEAAACQGISLATAKRRWAVARAWLYDALSEGTHHGGAPA